MAADRRDPLHEVWTVRERNPETAAGIVFSRMGHRFRRLLSVRIPDQVGQLFRSKPATLNPCPAAPKQRMGSQGIIFRILVAIIC
jgi:hypothetical protein